MTGPDLGTIFREVDELNEVCWTLREGHLQEHADARPNAAERLYVACTLAVRDRTGDDHSAALGVLPRSLAEELARR